MNGALYDLSVDLQHGAAAIHALHLNPWAMAIIAGLLLAWLEQRRAARRAPPFTTAHTGIHPEKPH